MFTEQTFVYKNKTQRIEQQLERLTPEQRANLAQTMVEIEEQDTSRNLSRNQITQEALERLGLEHVLTEPDVSDKQSKSSSSSQSKSKTKPIPSFVNKQSSKKAISDKILKDPEALEVSDYEEPAAPKKKKIIWLSLHDIGQYFKIIVDKIKGDTEHTSKKRISEFGKHHGKYGNKFKTMGEQADAELIEASKKQLKEGSGGIEDWYSKLLKDGGKDNVTLRACTDLLCEVGAFRFDDPAVWRVYNQYYKSVAPSEEYEQNKINMNGGKNAAGDNSVLALQKMMNRIFGDPVGTRLYNTNQSAYNTEMKDFEPEAIDLATGPDGLGGALQQMIIRHQQGEYQSPAKFESMLRVGIKLGFGSFSEKIFYLLAGYTLKNPKTNTYLLNKERIKAIAGELWGHMPQLNFFNSYKPLKGYGNDPRLSESMPRAYMKSIFDGFGFKPTMEKGKRFNQKSVSEFLWKNMMIHNSSLSRAGFIIKDGQKISHDDTLYIIPTLDRGAINIALGAQGNQAILSPDGHANAAVGFNQYIKSLGELALDPNALSEERKEQGFQYPAQLLQTAFKSFLYYESAITGRTLYNPTHEQSILASEKLNGPARSDDSGVPVRQHINAVKEVLREILQAYNVPADMITVYLDTSTGRANQEGNKIHVEKMLEFESVFDSLIASQGAQKMVDIVSRAAINNRLKGIEPSAVSSGKQEDEMEGANSSRENIPSVDFGDGSDVLQSIKDASRQSVKKV